MRVSSDIASLDIAPGSKADVTLDVVNTGSVIDGITARVVGLPERNVTTSPSVLPLFPDSAGRLTVTLGLPQSFPAGRHPMTVEVLSRQPDSFPAYVNVDLEVPRTPALGIASHPEVVRARRTARFIVTVTNRGNVLLDVDLKVNDPQKLCAVTTTPTLMTLPPGASAEAIVSVRAKRMILGADVDRALTVEALARPAAPPSAPTRPPAEPSLPADPAPPPDGDAEESGQADEPLTEQVPITYRQRPYLTRGVLTALILFAIIALWAAAFLFGLTRVFAGDPLTKTAPASFFAATPADGQASASASAPQTAAGDPLAGGAGAAAAPGDGGAAGKAAAGAADPGSADPAGNAAANRAAPKAAPFGAVPKSGALPAGVGGTLTGTVTARSSGQPVGRILVEALRVKADGSTVTAASAATQSDGSYQISGLFPGSYLLRFSGSGFKTSYYPAASTPAKAQTLDATAGAVNPQGHAIVTGLPATISGTIDPGDTTQKVTTTVSARLLEEGPGAPAKPIPAITAKRDTNGTYSYEFDKLPAPGNYQLTFKTPGYQTSTVETTVTGGAQRFESQVVLSAGTAEIAGTVTDGTSAIGGATVTTTVNGQQITTGTPTSGKVGHFVIGNLPTPATYVITVSKSGYGRFSQVIDLAPNKPQDHLKIVLRSGTGVVEGTLRDENQVAIGGAKVTVGGLADPPSTVTLTYGAIGSFRLTGLPTPGSYTLTFSKDGYADQTVPITLEAGTVLPPQNVVMPRSVGTVTGVVSQDGKGGLAGATVTATDGQRSWPVITTGNAAGNPVGSYTVAGLPAGIYTVTASDAAGHSQTALVTVDPGKTSHLNFRLPGGE